MNEPTDRVETKSPASGADLRGEIIAHIETDRFCEKCWYNLHGQPIWRDDRTDLLVASCPECGRFTCATDATTAGRVWLRRLGVWLLGQWLMLVIVVFLAWPIFQFINTVVVIDEMMSYSRWIEDAQKKNNLEWIESIKQGIIWTKILCIILAAAFGFTSTWMLTVVTPHWRKWAYLFPPFVFAILIGAGAFTIFFFDRQDLAWKYFSLVLMLQTGYFIGGVVGAFAGRPLARLLVRLFLPRTLRGPLGYLWKADGRTPTM